MISEEIRAELREVGLNTDDMISRFLDSEEKFLKYFKSFFGAADGVVSELNEAVNNGDLSAIERSAHALKGLSGNIGLNGVYGPAKKIVDDIRAGKTDEYRTDFEGAYAAYCAALAISKKI
jgi:HPt (histidine-containing phosphotransfer) domain-containing protein